MLLCSRQYQYYSAFLSNNKAILSFPFEIYTWFKVLINCHFVFKEKHNFKSAFYYFLLALFILCMNNIVLLIYSAILGLPLYIVKIFTELTLFIISYTSIIYWWIGGLLLIVGFIIELRP